MERIFLGLPQIPYIAPSSSTCLKVVLMSWPIFSILNTYAEGGEVVSTVEPTQARGVDMFSPLSDYAIFFPLSMTCIQRLYNWPWCECEFVCY